MNFGWFFLITFYFGAERLMMRGWGGGPASLVGWEPPELAQQTVGRGATVSFALGGLSPPYVG